MRVFSGGSIGFRGRSGVYGSLLRSENRLRRHLLVVGFPSRRMTPLQETMGSPQAQSDHAVTEQSKDYERRQPLPRQGPTITTKRRTSQLAAEAMSLSKGLLTGLSLLARV